MKPAAEPPRGAAQPHLKRSLSLPLITLYGLGTTVGAGIYVLVGKVAGRAELFTPAAFVVAALLAGLSAFAFAELSSRYPKSAGEALYVREGLGSPRLALFVGLLVALSGIISAAAIVVGASGYLHVFLPWPPFVLVLALVAVLGLVSAWGIAESVTAAAVVTVIEIGGLALVTWSGLTAIPDALTRLPDLVPPLELGAWQGILAGTVLAFYAFIGFEDMVNVAEEVKDVRRNLPRAIVFTLLLTTLIYIVLAVVAVLALPTDELAASDAPLALLYERTGGGHPGLVTAIAILATLNGALIQIIMGSRVLYGLSRQGVLPASLGRVNATTRTPLFATGLVTLLVLSLALWLPIEQLAEATSLVVLVVFSLVNLSLLLVKRRVPPAEDVWVVPWIVPLAGFVASTAFFALQASRLLGI